MYGDSAKARLKYDTDEGFRAVDPRMNSLEAEQLS